MAGSGVADFRQDLGDGDELVGAVGELIAALDDGVGVNNGHGYAFGGVAALGEDSG